MIPELDVHRKKKEEKSIKIGLKNVTRDKYQNKHYNGTSFPDKESNPLGGDRMDDSTRDLINRLDQDIRDHKQETRDRDARIQSEFQEREKRIHDEASAREQRLFDLVNGVRSDITDSLNKMESKIDKIEAETRNTYKHITGITIASISMAVATVLAIAALVISLVAK